MEAGNTIVICLLILAATLVFGTIKSGVPLFAYGQSPVQNEHPNIVLVLVDNEPSKALGTYGGLGAETPNTDKFADEGIKFTRAYATNTYCSPTRASLMTALMPSQNGVHDALVDAMQLFPNDWVVVQEFRTIPQSLADRGYDTALFGKFHMGSPHKPAIGSKDWVTFPLGHTINYYNNTIIDNGKTYRLEGQHIVDFFTKKAVDYIGNHTNTNSSKPFFMVLSLDGPYLNSPTNLGPDYNNRFYNYYANKSDFNLWPRESVNENLLGQLAGSVSSFIDPKFWPLYIQDGVLGPMRQLNDNQSIANMQSQIALVDDNFGKVLNALKENGIDKDTLVIYTSDQANFIGQHGKFGHGAYYVPSSLEEDIIRVPFLVKEPGITPSNLTTDMLISQYDLGPTIMDYAGFPDVVFDNSPGKSFTSFLKGRPLDNWSKEVYYEQGETRGVSTKDYALWERVNATNLNLGTYRILEGQGLVIPKFWQNEFYDLRVDPEQNNNLYNDLKYSNVIKDLHTKLTQFFNKYADPKYDLWNGGSAKAFIIRDLMWKQMYGDKWNVITGDGATVPKFTEAGIKTNGTVTK